jgi:hypothetical protein
LKNTRAFELYHLYACKAKKLQICSWRLWLLSNGRFCIRILTQHRIVHSQGRQVQKGINGWSHYKQQVRKAFCIVFYRNGLSPYILNLSILVPCLLSPMSCLTQRKFNGPYLRRISDYPPNSTCNCARHMRKHPNAPGIYFSSVPQPKSDSQLRRG